VIKKGGSRRRQTPKGRALRSVLVFGLLCCKIGSGEIVKLHHFRKETAVNQKLLIPENLKAGDKVAIVSLSRGILGENFVKHELPLGEKRLTELGLRPVYMENAKKGLEYLEQHPEARADDLKQAFADPEIRAVLAAVGGDDTYRTVPYLLDDAEFGQLVRQNPKIFLGFSDTTINHLTLYKLGLATFYGQAFLPDLAELGPEMLPYSKQWLMSLFGQKISDLQISPTWYLERKSYGADQVGVEAESRDEQHGYEFINGQGIVKGQLLGGCLESLAELVTGDRYQDEKQVNEKYQIFPTPDQWQDKILFTETSEERPSPERYAELLKVLESQKIFQKIKGIIHGKPQDETYYNEYKKILTQLAEKYDLPVVYNLNFGHSTPRMIFRYGQEISLDFDKQKLTLI
jgi:muramoyltetrapeptide carboxypeptidase LdcA involved in peptidoglycan recycling